MSGFTPEWLSLREPADRAARHGDVLGACAAYFAHRTSVTVCDLGAGTGALLRAIAARLPSQQQWRLLDNDRSTLAAARTTLMQWADTARAHDNTLHLVRDGTAIQVVPCLWDLSEGCGPYLEAADLAAASALFDLVSEKCIGEWVADLARRRTPLLATLTFDGTIGIEPPHPLDEAVIEAFRCHQQRDKGFGPAMGALAHGALGHHLRAAGYDLVDGPSPWRLTGETPGLVETFFDGLAEAAAESGIVRASDVETWREIRRKARTVTVGHRDLFAWPADLSPSVRHP